MGSPVLKALPTCDGGIELPGNVRHHSNGTLAGAIGWMQEVTLHRLRVGAAIGINFATSTDGAGRI